MGCLALCQFFGWIDGHLVACKLGAAEFALLFNFCGSEYWVFKDLSKERTPRGWPKRLVWFQVVCGLGFVGGAWLLRLLHQEWGWNLWLANLVAIGVAACWNFTVSRLAWKFPQR